jgi:AcrR family transcriptional regulator
MNEPVRPNPRARSRGPSPEKTARTRRAIVSAALDTFLERGFSDARMIDVAARAGVAKGTLYLYYPDKEALFEGVLREVISGPVASLGAMAPEPGESVRSLLTRVVLPILRDMESSGRGPVIRLIVAEGGRFPALAEMYRRLVIEPASEAIRQVARHAHESGELATDALVRFPQLFVAPGLLSVLWNGLFGPARPLDAEAMFLAHMDILFAPRGG